MGIRRIAIFRVKSSNFYRENIDVFWHKLPNLRNLVSYIALIFFEK
jgi:hypothetical protein